MKAYKLVVLIAGMSLLMAGCAPDLVITTFEKTGDPIVNPQNSVEIPIRVVVKNQGNGEAGIFKVATHYTDPSGSTYAVQFTVPGQSDLWYPYTNAPLAAGSDVTFAGKVTFHPAVHGVTVSLKGTADSCSGDELKPEYCRVKESNESNNESTPISVPLP